jgi:hypothetical protein
MTHPPSTLVAVVAIEATSEPAFGSVIPKQKIFSPAERRREVVLLLFFRPELLDRRNGHVGLHRHRHSDASGIAASHLFGQHDVAEIIPTASAVLLGERETEEPQLAETAEDLIGEVTLRLPLVGVRR